MAEARLAPGYHRTDVHRGGQAWSFDVSALSNVCGHSKGPRKEKHLITASHLPTSLRRTLTQGLSTLNQGHLCTFKTDSLEIPESPRPPGLA